MHSSHFSIRYVWIILLAIWFPVTFGFPGNSESFVINSSNAVYSYEIDQGGQSPRKKDGQPFGVVSRRYSMVFKDQIKQEDHEDDFPKDLFTDEQRRHGALVLHAFLGFYCFLLTAFVCHNYLLPALDRICVTANISTDVAGATFLALASSLPEMFVNVIGTFLTKSDLGVSTVVGSAVFDTFATPAVGALAALHAVPLEWHVLTRDCFVFIISVGTLVIIIWDGRVAWYEAVILLVEFFLYLISLLCGKRVVRSCSDGISNSTANLSNIDNVLAGDSYQPYLGENSISNSNTMDSVQQRRETKDPENLVNTNKRRKETKDPENLENTNKSEEHQEEPENLFVWPKERSVVAKFWFLLVWPLKFLLYTTIPDTRYEQFRNWYPVTFLMSVIWLGVSSYLVSWMITVIGGTIGIPDSVMGLTFLAAGGNMPEISSIVILARQGDGNMAMSNTLGANILDILLCLGLPWTIKCLLTGGDVKVFSGALSYSILSIIGCIIILYAVIATFRFQLNKKVGLICLFLYALFLVFSILAELKLFGITQTLTQLLN